MEPLRWKNLLRQSTLTQGTHVAAGDRFESFVPGYQVVKDQSKMKRAELAVLSAGVAADLRSVVVRSAPRTAALNYAVTLPDGLAAERAHDPARRELPQHAAIDVLTDLTGVEAEWRDAAGQVGWSGWLPHMDLTVAQALTGPSAEHSRLFALLKTPGSLVLRTQWDLHLMLRPAIQPGAKIDFEYPAETVTVALKPAAGARLAIKAPTAAQVEQRADGEIRVTTTSRESRWWPVEVTLTTGGAVPALDVAWHTVEDARPRALPLRRFMLPFAIRQADATTEPVARKIPEIAGGDWLRGREVYLGQQAACAACHKAHGEGGLIGPDLSNLVYRDYASVMQDIVHPSAAINPDRIAYVVTLSDGSSANGIVLENTPQAVVLGQVSGANLTIPKNTITGMKASAVSLMPEGLLQSLDQSQIRDLMTFLLTEPPTAKRN